jgi:hypothetical protein
MYRVYSVSVDNVLIWIYVKCIILYKNAVYDKLFVRLIRGRWWWPDLGYSCDIILGGGGMTVSPSLGKPGIQTRGGICILSYPPNSEMR